MSVVDVVLWVIVALVALTILGVVGVVILYGLARTPDRSAVRVLASDEVDKYFARDASFAITVTERTPLSDAEVWKRLLGEEYLSRLPFITGPLWESGARGIGARRTMFGTVMSVSELVVEEVEQSRITLVGTAVSLPLSIKDFAERFVLEPGPRGTLLVSWTIAGSPRWVGFLPWRWGVPFTRPVFAFVLRHILRLKPFRPARQTGVAVTESE